MPVIVRIVGRSEDDVRSQLAVLRPELAVYDDMEAAMDHLIRIAGAS